jgi:hypothetical protein
MEARLRTPWLFAIIGTDSSTSPIGESAPERSTGVRAFGRLQCLLEASCAPPVDMVINRGYAKEEENDAR